MAKTYQQRKEQINQIRAQMSLAGRDIGELPPVKNKRRKNTCKNNFKKFCITYFPEAFYMGFSADHEKAISKIEQSVLQGGLFALAMPRGSGKTTLVEKACLWALLYGHRSFIFLVGASETASHELLGSIKTELECNERLLEDFPEVVFPIAKLSGISNRANGQLYRGIRTRISWTATEIVLPTIADSPASGSIIRCAGITGRIRGAKHTLADGRSIRPNLVVIDDCQTTESAYSAEQTRKRLAILQTDILGLAGPQCKISGIMPCTVIKKGDLADQILDPKKAVEWQGERCKLCYAFPANNELWERYEAIRADSLRSTGTIAEATEFYKTHQKEMDAGCIPAWKERYNPDEISAVQNIMNLKIQDASSFFSEYQNEPLVEDESSENQIDAEVLITKLNGLQRGIVPLACNRLTMYIDVQKAVLFYVICAWNDNFTGSVIEYGTSPAQTSPHYTLQNLQNTIQAKYPKLSLEAQLYQELESLTLNKLSREYKREDGIELKIERCMIDANWGESTNIVYQFCRQSAFSALLMPSHGKGIGSGAKPISQYRKSLGDRFGVEWYIPRTAGKRALRHIIYNTNYWKSFVCNRLNMPIGEKSSLSIYGNRTTNHETFFTQLQAEYKIRTESQGRVVDEWKCRIGRDNHFFDCVVGASVAASYLGSSIPEASSESKIPKQRISLKAIQNGSSEEKQIEESAISTTGKLSLRELQKLKQQRR